MEPDKPYVHTPDDFLNEEIARMNLLEKQRRIHDRYAVAIAVAWMAITAASYLHSAYALWKYAMGL